MMALASARERNHSMLRQPSRKRPLKLSLVPFCQGLPGSIERCFDTLLRHPAQESARNELSCVFRRDPIAVPTASDHDYGVKSGYMVTGRPIHIGDVCPIHIGDRSPGGFLSLSPES